MPPLARPASSFPSNPNTCHLSRRRGRTDDRFVSSVKRPCFSHYPKITSQSAAVAHALLRAVSSLSRPVGALEQRASAKVPTRHARALAPRPPVIQGEVILASALSLTAAKIGRASCRASV